MRSRVLRGLFVGAFAAAIIGVRVPDAGADTPPPAPESAKTHGYATISRMDPEYTSALGAHDLARARARNGKKGSFHGTVIFVHKAHTGGLAVLEFDKISDQALTAVIYRKRAAAFPDLEALTGREILVSGRFSLLEDEPMLEVSRPAQVRIVHP